MPDDITAWADSFKEVVEETQNALCANVAETTKALFKTVVVYSPHKFFGSRYSVGQFMANWQVGSDIASSPILGIVATPQQKIDEINSKITPEFFKTNKSAFMINCLDYADKVEYEGWKITAPYMPVDKATSGWSGEAPITRSITDYMGV